MAADLGLVPHAAERDAMELPAERAGNRPAERRLAHAWRTHEAEDRILAGGADLLHREVLQDPLLDLLEPFVILVENRARRTDVDIIGRRLLPRHRHEPVDVRPRHGVLRRGRRHLRQPVELAKRLLLRLLGHAGRLDLVAQLIDLLRAIVGVAQLFLDCLHLLAQIVLSLRLRHLRLGFRLDLRAELEDLDLFRQGHDEPLQALSDADRLQDLLAQRRRKRRERSGDEVRDGARALRGAEHVRELVGEGRRQRDDLLEEPGRRAGERFDLEGRRRRRLVTQALDSRAEERRLLHDLADAEAAEPLHDQTQGAVGLLQRLVNEDHRTDRVKLRRARILRGRIALHDRADDPTALERVLDEPDRSRSTDRQWRHRLRKNHRAA